MIARCLYMVLTGLLVAEAPALAKNLEKDFRHTFPASRGTVLYLAHGNGEVTLSPWANDSIAVHVHYRADVKKVGWGKEPDFEVEFSQSGETVRVVGRETGGGKAGFLTVSHEDYRVEIQAPTYVALDFEGTDGDVTVEGWQADVAIRLEDGIAALRNVTAGQVRASIEDGRITLDGIHADVFVNGENGNVDLDLESSPRLDLDVFTRSGSVRVAFAQGSSIHYAVETKTGRIRVSLPGAIGGRDSKDRASGDWNGGEGRLSVITIDGPVELRQASR